MLPKLSFSLTAALALSVAAGRAAHAADLTRLCFGRHPSTQKGELQWGIFVRQ
jgi:hypothetical protein